MEEQEEKYMLIKTAEYYWVDYCHSRVDVCTYCWTYWSHGEPCIFYKKLVIMDNNKIKVYKIKKKKLN